MPKFYELQDDTTEKELLQVLNHLISHLEYEVVVFKEAKNDY